MSLAKPDMAGAPMIFKGIINNIGLLSQKVQNYRSLLKGRKYDVNAKAGPHCALFWTTIRDNAQMITIVLQGGADPNIRAIGGMTPLIMAASRCNSEIVNLLLKSGADPEAKDEDGVTAARWAYKNGCSNAEEILSSPLTKRARP